MTEGSVGVQTREFARAYTNTDLPPHIPGADVRKNDRGYFIRFDLGDLESDDASKILSKARETFDVEIVEQVLEDGEIAKERRYVESVTDVPDKYAPERGPQGGIYYETSSAEGGSNELDDANSATESVGYSGEPVLAVHFDDVDEGDRVAFERGEEHDVGEVVSIDQDEHVVEVETGDGTESVMSETFDLEKALYKDCEGHHVGPYTNGVSVRLEDGEIYCEDTGEVYEEHLIDGVEGECPECGDMVALGKLYRQDHDGHVKSGNNIQCLETGEEHLPDAIEAENEICPSCGDRVDVVATMTKAGGDFVSDIYWVMSDPSDGEDDDFESPLLGIAVDFPNHDVYVDWQNEVFPDELDEPHVSIYGSIEDLEQATGNRTQYITDIVPPDVQESLVSKARTEVLKEGDGGSDGGGTGTLTSDTAGAHNEVHSETELPSVCRLCDNEREEGSMVCAECAEDDVEKAGNSWVSYVGPNGGEGWVNVQTGEKRYQKERPGEGHDEYEEDPFPDGWGTAPEDPREIVPGQTVEMQTEDGEYIEAEAALDHEGDVVIQGDELPTENVWPAHLDGLNMEVTAAEEVGDDHPFDPELVSLDPSEANEFAEQFEPGDTVTLDTRDVSIVDEPAREFEVMGYVQDGYSQGDLAVYPDEDFIEANPDVTHIAVGSDDYLTPEEAEEVQAEAETGDESDESPNKGEYVDVGEDESIDPDDVSEGTGVFFERYDGNILHAKITDMEGGISVEGEDGATYPIPEDGEIQAIHESQHDAVGVSDGSDDEPHSTALHSEEEVTEDAEDLLEEIEESVHAAETEHYDLESYDPGDVEEYRDMSDIGANHGNSVAAMDVAVLPDGSKMVEKDVNHHSVTQDDIEREIAGYKAGQHLYENIPTHTADLDEGWAASEVVPGVDAVDATSEMKAAVDEDDFYEMAASQVLIGNTDLHQNNVRVDEDGNLYPFDLDRAAGDVKGDWVGNLNQYDDSLDRMLGELEKSATALDVQMDRSAVVEKAREMANEVDGPTQHLIQEEVGEVNEEFAETIAKNIVAFANGEVSL